jgi:TRAP-type C4-dicarboxylate transport system permease small subunit
VRGGLFSLCDDWSGRASQWLYALGVYGALPALLLLVTLDVLLRYFFDAPLAWGRDANGLLLLITLLSAFPRAWDRGHHIRMEMLYARQSPPWRSVADVTSALAGIAVFGMVAVQGFAFARYMRVTGETGEELMLPMWPFMAFVGVCATVFVARLLVNPTGAAEASREDGTWT